MNNNSRIKARIAQFKSRKLWIDNVPIGLAVFGVINGFITAKLGLETVIEMKNKGPADDVVDIVTLV